MIESLKDLEKLLKLCRKQGVVEFEYKGTRLKLGDLPVEHTPLTEREESTDTWSDFPDGLLTPEQMMFYSAGGLPQDDPLNPKAGVKREDLQG